MDWDALLIGLLSCGAVRGAYTLLDARLRVHARAYATLKPHKQKYVVKNMIKAMYLAVLLAGAVPLVLVPIARDGHWYSARIRRFGMLYVSNDAVGLACVPRLPTTTRIHHCVTICLVVAAMAIDFQTSDVGQAMLVYTVASAAAASPTCRNPSAAVRSAACFSASARASACAFSSAARAAAASVDAASYL